jgi:hypothetical protein
MLNGCVGAPCRREELLLLLVTTELFYNGVSAAEHALQRLRKIVLQETVKRFAIGRLDGALFL